MDRIDIEVTNSPIDPVLPFGFVMNITDLVGDSFSFTKKAMGGYVSASLNFQADEATAYLFLSAYMGKRIVFTSPYAKPASQIIWEGKIYTVKIEGAYSSMTRSMANVFNRVEVDYSIANLSTTPPSAGALARTPALNDLPSQALYGIRHLRTSGGTLTGGDAGILASLLLAENKVPRGEAQASNKRGDSLMQATPLNVVKVSVDCVGFWEHLDKQVWSEPATTIVTYDTIISSITYGGGGFFNLDQTLITPNASLRTKYFADGTTTAQTAVEQICALGDSTGAYQWACGCGADRKVYYRRLDFAIEHQYVMNMSDPSGSIYRFDSGEPVAPYLVEPGYMMWIPDLLPDTLTYTDAVSDARNQLIDEVTFIAPNTVVWKPRPFIDAVNLRLARLGAGYLDVGSGALYFPDFPRIPGYVDPGDIYGWADAVRDLEKRLQGGRPTDIVGWPGIPDTVDGRIAQP